MLISRNLNKDVKLGKRFRTIVDFIENIDIFSELNSEHL